MYSDSIYLGGCDIGDCRTFACKSVSNGDYKWSPNCICSKNDAKTTAEISFYRRLSNGTCVLLSDPSCVTEFQPSPGLFKFRFTIFHEEMQ